VQLYEQIKNPTVFALIDNVDLVMWTKNGAHTLPTVFSEINKVLPKNVVNKKIVVDDQSTDETCQIARSYGWTVINNQGSGISDGANTALKHVESDFFISFEQDLVLSDDWWLKVPKHLDACNVAVASGVRLPNKPQVVKKIQEFTMERNQRGVNSRDTFLYGKTIDNTVYKTDVIRSLGGFPKLSVSAGVDNVLALKLKEQGFEWVVDYSVESIHLRKGLVNELSHEYWYGTCYNALNIVLYKKNVNFKKMLLRGLLSPMRGLEIAFKKNAPSAIIVYPLMRFSVLKGISDGIKADC